MPFGGDCEYADFDACKRANRGKRDPDAYCGSLMRDTEKHCGMKRSSSLDTDKKMSYEDDELSYDQWDGLLITQWFDAGPGAPVPASSREGEFKYAHENPDAWLYFEQPIDKATAMSIMDAEVIIQEGRHLAGQHNQLAHAGKFTRAELSDAKASDLVDRLQTPDGGFTINPRTGAEVTSGYAVAAYSTRSKEVPVTEVSSDTLKSYVDANRDLLNQEGNMFGGWHDPDTGQVWLDISKVTSDKAEAVTLAKLTNQIAIFDLGTGQSINTGGTGRSRPFVGSRHLPGKHSQKTHGGGSKSTSTSDIVAGSDQSEWVIDTNRDGNNLGLPVTTDLNDPVDRSLQALGKRQGFDGKPTKGSIEDTVAAGGIQIHRGVVNSKTTKKSGQDIVDDFRDGNYEPGTGIYGNGFYFSVSSRVAGDFAKGSGGRRIRAALKPKARVIDYDELTVEMEKWKLSNKDRTQNIVDLYKSNFQTPGGMISPHVVDYIAGDPGRFAAMMGYDAIRVTGRQDGGKFVKGEPSAKNSSGKRFSAHPQYIVLNRTALVVES